MSKIHYVAAFFFTVSRDELKNEAKHYFSSHMNVLRNEKVSRITFVINSNSPKVDLPLLSGVLQDLSEGLSADLYVRENKGYSYGAWEYALDKIGVDPESDYFLVEGDYVPNSDFLEPFVNQMNPEVGFVAQKIDSIPGSAPEHASISNGLLSGKWAEQAERRFGRIFAIYPFTLTRGEHLMGCENQVTFLQFVVESGAKIAEISREYSIPFFETTLNKTFEHGSAGAFAPLRPIQEI